MTTVQRPTATVCDDDLTATIDKLVYHKDSLVSYCTVDEFNRANGIIDADSPHTKVPIIGITSIRSLEEGVADPVLTIDGVDVTCNPVARCYPAAQQNAVRIAFEELGFRNVLPCIHASRFETRQITNLPPSTKIQVTGYNLRMTHPHCQYPQWRWGYVYG
jgi:hypothetical protein